MANPQTATFAVTGDTLVDAMTNGYYWRLDSSKTIDWSLSNGFSGEFWTSPSEIQNNLSLMFRTISAYTNVEFNYVGYATTPIAAGYIYGSEINVSLTGSNTLISSPSVWAVGYFPDDYYNQAYYPGAVGDIYVNLNSGANYLPSYDVGSSGWSLLLHEIGHTLGLKHPHDDGGTGRPTFSQIGWDNLNIDWMTVMSYQDDYNWNNYSLEPATPMILDLIALQALYGIDTATNSGDSTHYLENLSGYYSTLWDSSGTDTLNVSSSNKGWVIQLPNKQLSSLVSTKAGYATYLSEFDAITSGSSPTSFTWLAGDMENVSGSYFGDRLLGNEFDNTINGNSGNDFILGDAGNDILNGGSGNDEIYGGDGNDKFDYVSFTSGLMSGVDTFYGGNGNDSYSLDSILDRVVEYENEGDFDIISVAAFDYSLQNTPHVEGLSAVWATSSKVLTGNSLDNFFFGSRFNDTIDGASGLDIFYTSYSSQQLTIIKTVGGHTINTGIDTDYLISIERIFSADANIALDTNGATSAGGIYRLYKATFNREPDHGGLGYWIAQADAGNKSAVQMAEDFTWSAEFQDLYDITTTDNYGTGTDVSDLVTGFYQNVLGRAPDQGGLDYYSGVIQTHEKTVGRVLAEISDSQENYDNTIDLIQNGIQYDLWVG